MLLFLKVTRRLWPWLCLRLNISRLRPRVRDILSGILLDAIPINLLFVLNDIVIIGNYLMILLVPWVLWLRLPRPHSILLTGRWLHLLLGCNLLLWATRNAEVTLIRIQVSLHGTASHRLDLAGDRLSWLGASLLGRGASRLRTVDGSSVALTLRVDKVRLAVAGVLFHHVRNLLLVLLFLLVGIILGIGHAAIVVGGRGTASGVDRVLLDVFSWACSIVFRVISSLAISWRSLLVVSRFRGNICGWLWFDSGINTMALSSWFIALRRTPIPTLILVMNSMCLVDNI